VDAAGNKDEGAGDQGIMFGYACTETPDLMPAPLFYAHLILRRISEMRRNNDTAVAGLLPDAKSQVTLRYVDGKPVGATSVVVSTQHMDGMEQAEIKRMLRPIVESTLPKGWMCPDNEFYVNPTGKFVIGGPDGDAGLTGRKIIVDTYGGAAPHGGGAFSGKDPTKVDRSAAYAAATSRRTSSRRAWRTSAPSRSPTRSASPSPCPSISTCTAPARLIQASWKRPSWK
jgi:S-adenosylmethionine synthetase